jgi:murein L,D-transpeptidase YcbB/YkuD
MPIWKGKGIRATDADIDAIAARAGIEPAALRAFRQIEAPRGPFDGQGRVTILFERHHFWKRTTAAQRAAAGPAIANPVAGGYGRESEQYGKFQKAFAINERAALESTSWGSGQTMGFNARLIGYKSAADMVEAYADSEVTQIEGIVAFLKANNLIGALKAKNWTKVAIGYNGAGQAKHNYSGRLAAAYAGFAKIAKATASGESAVLKQIKALGFASVADFQKAKGLKPDGIAGPITLAALKAA